VRTILLVEDESDMRRQIHKALEAQGHLVVDMHEGELALEMAQTLQPDVILLDMSLQGMSGGEVLRALADSPLTQSIPVIILGEAGDEVGSALPRVAKPISIGVLSGTIDGYLGVEVVR
jgi:CheY-like chemotaxis protein